MLSWSYTFPQCGLNKGILIPIPGLDHGTYLIMQWKPCSSSIRSRGAFQVTLRFSCAASAALQSFCPPTKRTPLYSERFPTAILSSRIQTHRTCKAKADDRTKHFVKHKKEAAAAAAAYGKEGRREALQRVKGRAFTTSPLSATPLHLNHKDTKGPSPGPLVNAATSKKKRKKRKTDKAARNDKKTTLACLRVLSDSPPPPLSPHTLLLG